SRRDSTQWLLRRMARRGYGYRCTEGSLQVYGGSYTMTAHRTKSEARTAARQHAYSFRNTVLTMGGCTFETLPVIRQVIVGGVQRRGHFSTIPARTAYGPSVTLRQRFRTFAIMPSIE